MKKIILFVLIVLAAFAYYKINTNPQEKSAQKESSNYVSDLLETKKTAEEKINQAVQQENNKINENSMENENLELIQKYDRAILKTSLGDIEVKFFADKSPQTVENFLKLAQENFYDDTAFHRVIKDFMIQGGDPLSKQADWTKVAVGTGDPGYKFNDEINDEKLVRGSLAMANSGPNTNGSQFFIVTAEATPWLDGHHTNFGQVISGMEVIDQIEKSATNSQDQPLEKITIDSVELIEK